MAFFTRAVTMASSKKLLPPPELAHPARPSTAAAISVTHMRLSLVIVVPPLATVPEVDQPAVTEWKEECPAVAWRPVSFSSSERRAAVPRAATPRRGSAGRIRRARAGRLFEHQVNRVEEARHGGRRLAGNPLFQLGKRNAQVPGEFLLTAGELGGLLERPA